MCWSHLSWVQDSIKSFFIKQSNQPIHFSIVIHCLMFSMIFTCLLSLMFTCYMQLLAFFSLIYLMKEFVSFTINTLTGFVDIMAYLKSN